jgi:hypothetical protein
MRILTAEHDESLISSHLVFHTRTRAHTYTHTHTHTDGWKLKVQCCNFRTYVGLRLYFVSDLGVLPNRLIDHATYDAFTYGGTLFHQNSWHSEIRTSGLPADLDWKYYIHGPIYFSMSACKFRRRTTCPFTDTITRTRRLCAPFRASKTLNDNFCLSAKKCIGSFAVWTKHQ